MIGLLYKKIIMKVFQGKFNRNSYFLFKKREDFYINIDPVLEMAVILGETLNIPQESIETIQLKTGAFRCVNVHFLCFEVFCKIQQRKTEFFYRLSCAIADAKNRYECYIDPRYNDIKPPSRNGRKGTFVIQVVISNPYLPPSERLCFNRISPVAHGL